MWPTAGTALGLHGGPPPHWWEPWRAEPAVLLQVLVPPLGTDYYALVTWAWASSPGICHYSLKDPWTAWVVLKRNRFSHNVMEARVFWCERPTPSCPGSWQEPAKFMRTVNRWLSGMAKWPPTPSPSVYHSIWMSLVKTTGKGRGAWWCQEQATCQFLLRYSRTPDWLWFDLGDNTGHRRRGDTYSTHIFHFLSAILRRNELICALTGG